MSDQSQSIQQPTEDTTNNNSSNDNAGGSKKTDEHINLKVVGSVSYFYCIFHITR